ncbi:hypothetical protein BGZ99_009684 [Dissophora globulifera]|uniref:Succinate--CoA ligase [ADP-forming] subunit beta, mitochondrial n=1 Tax=Dissophora globulifera TaxID=979702 RepID=A0A9P6UYL4_9FUNG|nr:hypothetical protein BGZ99_009684 [Dissophora globulifera]
MLRHAFKKNIPLTGVSHFRLTQHQFPQLACKALTASQVRYLNLHEYQAKELMAKHNVNVQRFSIAESVEQAQKAAVALKADEIVIKAQIHAGGRGKGVFSSGLKSGVHLTKDPAKVPGLVSEMLGYKLKTKQTSEDGVLVSKVMIAEALDIAKETYFAILMDRDNGGPVLVGSPDGGMDIEQVAETHPDHIFTTPINIETGPTQDQTTDMAKKLGFQGKSIADASKQMQNLYDLFINVDATQIEINPFGLTPDNRVVCFDAKISFDDNAAFKHPELQTMRDTTEENPREVEAQNCGLSYVGMDGGNIGCLVNGAGLALATMDIIQLHGAKPANFLDVGGGVTSKQVGQAFKILTDDKNVKTILVNIFGGIASCLTIAEGMVTALKEGPIKITVPIVVRLQGNQVEEGKECLRKSGLNITLRDDLDDAAMASVNLAGPACIHGSIPFVADCTSLTQTQLATLDSVIHGVRVYTNIGDYRTKDPGAFGCLKSLMWDVVHYNANLWSTCLDPETRCSWHEMMHYLEMIPKIAASYGVPNPPAQVLVNPPQ